MPLIDQGLVLRIDTYFIFKRSSIFTKKNTVKKKDHTNHIKLAHDALAKCLDIDDCYFFSGNCEKVIGERESITFVITTHVPMNEDMINE